MFESLQDGLRAAFKSLRGKGKLTESNMRDGLRMVEQALLEADVSYAVVQDFMTRVTQEALGQRVLSSLDPGQQLVGIVHQQLIQVMGPVDPALHLKGDVSVFMLCGLQGSGKTTTCGKLARLLQGQRQQVLLVAADLQRPAAIDQLHVLGEQLGVEVFSDRTEKDPVKVCQSAIQLARAKNIPVVILDTAGRLAIDRELMEELARIDRMVHPDQAYLVVDGMTGQDAVESARAFNEALELDGVILTKLDGDARGGAVLSVKHVTGVPVKFIGTGERLDALEPFRPEGMAGRILGMGDVVEMFRTAQETFDQDQMRQTEERLRQGEFNLEDFRKHLEQIARPGLIQKMMGLIPGMGDLRKMMDGMDTERDMKSLFGIIDSMTPRERRNPQIIDLSRRVRIAKGAGVEPHSVNELLKQFDAMASLMKNMAGKGIGERLKMAQDIQKQGLMDPGGRLTKPKQGTGKRLTKSERDQRNKDLERLRRRRKRQSD